MTKQQATTININQYNLITLRNVLQIPYGEGNFMKKGKVRAFKFNWFLNNTF